jgi:peptidyl-tRNA hydrolase, PTH1 family
VFKIFRRQRDRAEPPDDGDSTLIVGLGNPGKQYAGTRHNVGYRVVGRLSRRNGIDLKHSGVASVGQGRIEGKPVILGRPRTFMNKSGDALVALLERFKIPLSSLILVYDDLDLPTGALRLREKGGSGGARGMTSVIKRLGSDDFRRVRIGISRPYRDGEPVYDPASIGEWVLSEPPPEDARLLDEAADRAVEAVECVLRDGFQAAMNRFNRDASPE